MASVVANAGHAFVAGEFSFAAVTGIGDPLSGSFSLLFSDGSRWDVSGTDFAYLGPDGLPSAATAAPCGSRGLATFAQRTERNPRWAV